MRLRQKRRVEEAELVRRSTLASPCEKHPDWRVDVSDGRMPPCASSCPHCLRDSIGTRDDTKRAVQRVDVSELGNVTDRQLELAAIWFDKNPARRGVESESFAEQNALEAIDLARESEQGRDERRRDGARVVSQQIRGGRVRAWAKLPGHEGLIEVSGVERELGHV